MKAVNFSFGFSSEFLFELLLFVASAFSYFFGIALRVLVFLVF